MFFFLKKYSDSQCCAVKNILGGYGLLLRSECFFRTTQEFIFVCRAKREFFFQDLILGHIITKTLNHIIFFSSTKIRIFFTAI
jgi:hypothetical protein